MIDDIRRARAYLSAVSHPPAIALSGLISAAGPVDAASMVRGGSAVTANLVSPRESIDPEALLPQIEELGGRLVIPEDDEWPTTLNDLDVPVPDHELSCSPIALWVLGSAQLGGITSGSVAVVGSRAATAYGEHVAGEISYCLADAGFTILASSGFGVETAAHRGALATKAGRCVAVMGCGVDVTSPAAHHSLLQQVVARGMMVSELPPGRRPSLKGSQARDRVVAALASGVVVVESGNKGQVLRIASSAAALGRPVMAVPGPVTSSLSTGPHQLIREGRARLVTCASDVLGILAPAL